MEHVGTLLVKQVVPECLLRQTLLWRPPQTCRVLQLRGVGVFGFGSPVVDGAVVGTVVLFNSESNIASSVASVSREGSVEDACICVFGCR